MNAPNRPMRESIGLEDLISEVRRVIGGGLPTTEEAAGELLQLKSVYARAVVPSEPRSRLSALNELLPRLIASLDDADFRGAVQILFGLAPGTRGTTLTSRRRQAADLLGYSAGHFRNEVEERLLNALAVAIQDDLLRYRSRIKRAAESLEPTGDTPRLGPEHITHEEELISRIWHHVYGLRAELIAHARLDEAEGFEMQAEEHRQAAQREDKALLEILAEYASTYGDRLIKHGAAEMSSAALRRLSGHSSDISEERS